MLSFIILSFKLFFQRRRGIRKLLSSSSHFFFTIIFSYLAQTQILLSCFPFIPSSSLWSFLLLATHPFFHFHLLLVPTPVLFLMKETFLVSAILQTHTASQLSLCLPPVNHFIPLLSLQRISVSLFTAFHSFPSMHPGNPSTYTHSLPSTSVILIPTSSLILQPHQCQHSHYMLLLLLLFPWVSLLLYLFLPHSSSNPQASCSVHYGQIPGPPLLISSPVYHPRVLYMGKESRFSVISDLYCTSALPLCISLDPPCPNKTSLRASNSSSLLLTLSVAKTKFSSASLPNSTLGHPSLTAMWLLIPPCFLHSFGLGMSASPDAQAVFKPGASSA